MENADDDDRDAAAVHIIYCNRHGSSVVVKMCICTQCKQHTSLHGKLNISEKLFN